MWWLHEWKQIEQRDEDMDALRGQLVRLTKSLFLRPKRPERMPSAQFMAGKRDRLSPFSGFGLSWWYSDDTFPALNSVSTMIAQRYTAFHGVEPATINDIQMSVLQELCMDNALFDVDAVLFGQQETLFECASVEPAGLAQALLAAVVTRLEASMAQRCTIYAVPRLLAPSFEVVESGLAVIARNDDRAWARLEQHGYALNGWRPDSSAFRGRVDPAFAPPKNYGCLIVGEEKGTEAGARLSSLLRFRSLLAVMSAVATRSRGYAPMKAAAQPYTYFAQVTHMSATEQKWVRNDCAPLIPFYASDIQFTSTDIEAVRAWFVMTSRCEPQFRSRIQKAAHFLNLAMNASGIEEFVNYFIVLDALFGRRGAVEESIQRGVSRLSVNDQQKSQIKWLFDLRSELVHGGARLVEEWPKYGRYKRHFGTDPLLDVQRLAEAAVLESPTL